MPPSSISDKKQLKRQLLEAASQISDDEDDTVLESSSPNYRTHPEAFQDSQDPYDMRQIRRNDRTTDPLGNNYDRLLFISTQDRKIQKDILLEIYLHTHRDRLLEATIH